MSRMQEGSILYSVEYKPGIDRWQVFIDGREYVVTAMYHAEAIREALSVYIESVFK